MYLVRLDDACEYMDLPKWQRVFSILEKYSVCPLIGIIPKCQDVWLKKSYTYNEKFWDMARRWQDAGWIIAMHGLHHVYHEVQGGLNPIHNRSEFVGLSLEEQKKKIEEAASIFKGEGILPKVFFAPSHTFDLNTLKAIKEASDVRIICDGIAGNVYKKDDFFFLPCQMGCPRWLPLKFVGIALHPNNMEEKDFAKLEHFLKVNESSCIKSFDEISLLNRSFSLFDSFLRSCYFFMRHIFRKK